MKFRIDEINRRMAPGQAVGATPSAKSEPSANFSKK
jgi:hypothetical protein